MKYFFTILFLNFFFSTTVYSQIQDAYKSNRQEYYYFLRNGIDLSKYSGWEDTLNGLIENAKKSRTNHRIALKIGWTGFGVGLGSTALGYLSSSITPEEETSGYFIFGGLNLTASLIGFSKLFKNKQKRDLDLIKAKRRFDRYVW